MKLFKDGKEFQSFIQRLKKCTTAKFIEGELNAHLDHKKNKPVSGSNVVTITVAKQKSSYGETDIKVPHGCEGSCPYP